MKNSDKIHETSYGNFYLNPEDNVSKALCLYDVLWEKDIKPIFDSLTKDDVVVEVGSYVGDHTVYLSEKAGHVYAFEGDPDNYYYLTKNLKLNGCKNVSAHNLIVGIGNVRPASNPDDEFKNDKELNPSGNRFVPGGDLATITLDDFLPTLHKLTLLKVDCEGMDYDVLVGAEKLISKFNPIIIFEYNWYISTVKIEKYKEFLSQFGYTCERIDTWNWVARKEK